MSLPSYPFGFAIIPLSEEENDYRCVRRLFARNYLLDVNNKITNNL